MKTALTIKIPVALAKHAVWQRHLVHKYETNRLIKALDTWLVLKAETASSLIQSWNKQKRHLLQICKCSESIFRSRLRLLADLQLLHYDRLDIRLASWEDLGKIFDIDIRTTFTIQYNIDDKQRVQDWLIATEILDNQQRQAHTVWSCVNENPQTKQMIADILVAAGADPALLKDSEYFLQQMRLVYQQSFVRSSATHAVIQQYRPDTNRSVRTMARAWKARSAQTVSYWKGILEKTGIAVISSLQIQSSNRVRNNDCHVVWLKKEKETLLCLCDQIAIIMPWIRFKDNTDNTDFLPLQCSQ